MTARDRDLAPLLHRLSMMVARGELTATDDAPGTQTMQANLLAGETADGLERFQTFGVSSTPPAGSDVLVVFLGGNRDQGVVLAVNDRATRPRSEPGETVVYSSPDCTMRLTNENDLVVRVRRVVIEAEETVEIKARERITLSAPAIEMDEGA